VTEDVEARALKCLACDKNLPIFGRGRCGYQIILVEREDDALFDFLIQHEGHSLVVEVLERGR
jgi:hypothetical protein